MSNIWPNPSLAIPTLQPSEKTLVTSVTGTQYTFADKKTFPRFSHILDITSTAKTRDRLERWKEENPHEMILAPNFGTLVHWAGEQILKGQPIDLDEAPLNIQKNIIEPYQKCLDMDPLDPNEKRSPRWIEVWPDPIQAFEQCVQFLQPILESTQGLFWCEGIPSTDSKHSIRSENFNFAGTPDWGVIYNGQLSLLDLKTSKVPYYRKKDFFERINHLKKIEKERPLSEEEQTQLSLAFSQLFSNKKFEKVVQQLKAYQLAFYESFGIFIPQLIAVVCTPGGAQIITINPQEIQVAEKMLWDKLVKFNQVIQ